MADDTRMSLMQTDGLAGQACIIKQPEQPPYSECARIGRRSLSWFVWIPGISKSDGSALDRNNLNLSHEHIVFQQSGDNMGFGPHGLFSEQTSDYKYRFEETCYDGSKMRMILANLDYSKPYHFIKNNCQDFIAYVRSLYQR